ncbi:MAG: PaaI family thioesterase [Bacteroidetes bacterium]|nr:MAG: PaaI family thioesterase [Bacteroidota bacterium]
MKFKAAEADFIEMVKEKIGGNHFSQYIGIDIHRIAEGEIEATINLLDNHRQQMGFMHGGVTATLADVVSGFAAYTLVKRGQGVVTADLRVSYLNPGVGDKVYAKGYVIKAGSRMHFCEAEIWIFDGHGNRIDIAKSSSTMVVI